MCKNEKEIENNRKNYDKLHFYGVIMVIIAFNISPYSWKHGIHRTKLNFGTNKQSALMYHEKCIFYFDTIISKLFGHWPLLCCTVFHFTLNTYTNNNKNAAIS